MYGPPGIAYVYLVYGMHDCLNIVSEPDGSPAALLVRAVEPLEGVDEMRRARARRAVARRRSTAGPDEAAVADSERDRLRAIPAASIASGPGLVAAAFDLDRSQTGLDLFDPGSPIRIEPPPPTDPAPRVVTGPRVGIAYAGAPWTDKPWRFAIAGHRSVSRPPLRG